MGEATLIYAVEVGLCDYSGASLLRLHSANLQIGDLRSNAAHGADTGAIKEPEVLKRKCPTGIRILVLAYTLRPLIALVSRPERCYV